ncbi:MAG: sensor histidine kinase [Burkholderiaceae bacterium]
MARDRSTQPVLSLYRIENGTFVLQPEPVDLVTTLIRVRQEMLAALASMKLDIRLSGEEGGVPGLYRYTVQGEEGLCYSLFGNLLRNTAEVSREGSSINVKFSTEPGNVVVAISNTGLMPVAVRECFFNKYVTVGKVASAGLGAYSARLFAEAQCGTIMMDTDEARGTTTLTVQLPRR